MSHSSTRSDERWDWEVNEIDLPDPPPGCKVVVREGIAAQLYLPPPRWFHLGAEWFWCAILLAIGAASLLFTPVPGFHFGHLVGVFGLLLTAFTVRRAGTSGLFEVDNQRLAITLAGMWRSQRWEWHRDEVYEITVFRGLRLHARRQSMLLLQGRTEAELIWLALSLRALLGIVAEGQPSSDELEVGFTRDPEQTACVGYLRVIGRRLTIRRANEPLPEFAFWSATPTEQPSPLTWGIRIAEDNCQCRVDESETICLHINQPAVRLKLWVWCDDKDALHSALARFWGAAEE